MDLTGEDRDSAAAFYEKARKFTAARQEVWVPEEMLFKVLANVESKASHFLRPNNREFIVMQLVKRTGDLLRHKAKMDSASERSMAFELATQNIAEASRILKVRSPNWTFLEI